MPDHKISDRGPDQPRPDLSVADAAREAAADQLLPDQGTSSSTCPHPPAVSRCEEGWCTMPPGCFQMGSPTGEKCRDKTDEDQHQVTLTHSFELGATEVTHERYRAVMGYSPKKNCTGDNCPADGIGWYEAAAYCNRLSSLRGVPSCYQCSGKGSTLSCKVSVAYAGGKLYKCPGYRLPTEAEWEYAYRGRTTTAYYNGASTQCSGKDPKAELIGQYQANTTGKVQPVGKKAANPWGLVDMAGNVAEWTNDLYTAKLGTGPVTDPTGLPSGKTYTLRGGAAASLAPGLRAAARLGASATGFPTRGFRCARTLCESRLYDNFVTHSTKWSGGSLVVNKASGSTIPVIQNGIHRHAVVGK